MSDGDVDARIAIVEAMAADPSIPPTFRAQARKALEWLKEYRDADDKDREELRWRRDNKYPKWVREPELFRRLWDSGAVVDADGVVTVRWDLIAPEDRAAAYSYLNELVDGYRSRSVGGRPRK